MYFSLSVYTSIVHCFILYTSVSLHGIRATILGCSPAVAPPTTSLLLRLEPSGSLSCCIQTPPAAYIVLHLDISNSLPFGASGALRQPLSHRHRSWHTLFIFVATAVPHVIIVSCIVIAAAVMSCLCIIVSHCCTTNVIVPTSRASLKPRGVIFIPAA